MFSFIKNAYQNLSTKLSGLFSRHELDEVFLAELKKILITSDVGMNTTKKVIEHLQTEIGSKRITSIQEARNELANVLHNQLSSVAQPTTPRIVLLVGINGSGKTTFAAKYANYLKNKGRKVMLVAADTFRAAGATQLEQWGKRIGVDMVTGSMGDDPSSVIFDACTKFKDGNYDSLIIDTAGRLQTKINLIKELEKIHKVVGRQLPDEHIATWLTIDAMIGQNSFAQAQVFDKATNVSGLILSKLDSTAKGGIIFSIADAFKLPVVFVTHGEKLEDIVKFDSRTFVEDMLSS